MNKIKIARFARKDVFIVGGQSLRGMQEDKLSLQKREYMASKVDYINNNV